MFGGVRFLDNQTCWLIKTVTSDIAVHIFRMRWNMLLQSLVDQNLSLMIQKASEGCMSMGRVFQSVNPGEGSIVMHLQLRGKRDQLKWGSWGPRLPPHLKPLHLYLFYVFVNLHVTFEQRVLLGKKLKIKSWGKRWSLNWLQLAINVQKY